jgi:pimeloyl-ACP methyl ester carboxylesterase
LETIRKYGSAPFNIGLLHGGPGAAGEMKPVAEELSKEFGVLEFLQTGNTVAGQIRELYDQLMESADLPVTLVGYSWGAWLGFLFAGEYPCLLKKLILVSSGAFEDKYNKDFMKIRLDRLSVEEREKAERLISAIDSGDAGNATLKEFGELMTIADSYDYLRSNDGTVDLDIQIYRSVWAEAAELRRTGKLLEHSGEIRCPVVAIHGKYDTHPPEGVDGPLSDKLGDFKMIRIERCGHTPWKEKEAKDKFYEVLRAELENRQEKTT